MPRPVVALLLLLCCVLHATMSAYVPGVSDALLGTCFDDPAPLVSDRKINFWLKNWPGHELATTIGAILVREKLGYPVHINTDLVTGGNGGSGWDMVAEGTLDIDMEVWQSSAELSRTKSHGDGGALGQLGIETFYVPRYMTNVTAGAAAISCPVGQAAAGGSGRPTVAECGPNELYGWWKTLQSEAETVPFRRESTDTPALGRFYGPDESWSVGAYMRKMITSLDLKLEYFYAGRPGDPDWATTVNAELKAAMDNREPVIFFHYSPHQIHNQYDLVEVRFDGFSAKRYEEGTCGFPDQALTKTYNLALEQYAPDVVQYVLNAKMLSTDQEAMLTELDEGKSVFNAACDFLRNNPAKWRNAIPSLAADGCDAGFYVVGTSCAKCPENTFQNQTGHVAKSCQQCPIGTAYHGSGAVSATSCLCARGFYHPDGVSGKGKPCVECPYNAICEGGVMLPGCRPEGGFWIDSSPGQLSRVRACSANACLGGHNCTCAHGYTGPMCKLCIKKYDGHNESWYKSGEGCQRCNDTVEGAGIDPLTLFGLFACFIFVYVLVMRMAKYRKASDKMAVAIRYLQQLSLIINFELAWPAALLMLQQWLSFLNIDVLETVPLECSVPLSVTSSLLMKLFVLPTMLAIFLVAFAGWTCYITRDEGRKTTEDDKDPERAQKDTQLIDVGGLTTPGLKPNDCNTAEAAIQAAIPLQTRLAQLKNSHIQAFMHLLMILYMFHTKGFLGYFDCTTFQDSTQRWKHDLNVVCWEGEHLDAMPLALLGIALYVIGTPVIFLLALWRGRSMRFDFNFNGPTYVEKQLEKRLGTSTVCREGNARALFDEIDLNSNGRIDRSEFDALLSVLGVGSVSEKQRDSLLLEILSQCEDSLFITFKDLCKILGHLDRRRRFDARWRPIWLKFGAKTPWWEIVLVAQTVSIVTVKIVFSDDPLYAGVIALYLFIAFFLLQVVVTPFKSEPGNETALYCSLCTCLVLIGALAMTMIEAGTEKYTSIQVITVCSVVFGAYFIAKNAGMELYMNAKAELLAKLSASVMNIPIFQDCDPDFVEMCSKLMTIEKHHPNFVLCQLGDKGDRLWILTKGTVELRDSDGTVVNTFTAEEDVTPAFGELALMDDEARKYTITASTPIEVKVLTRKHLRACFMVHEGAENGMLAAVMMKYQMTHDPKVEAERLKVAPADVLLDILTQKEQDNASSAIILKKKKDDARAELQGRLSIQKL